jgi:polysaccharide pyruvyl transferase CsaB
MRAVLCGYYGMGNGGDEALLASLLQMLPNHVTPVVLSKRPAETRSRYNVEAYDRWNLVEILTAFRRADAFIWGGGSLVQDATSAISPLYYLGLMQFAQLRGLKTIAWAQGLGPLHRAPNRWLTRTILRRCTAVSVRDRGSAQLLDQWHISHTLAPDPVWALGGTPDPTRPNQPGQPRVAVNLRRYQTLTPERLDVTIQALTQFQTATNALLLLLPFQASLDLELAQELADRLPPHTSQVLQITDPLALRGLFDSVDMAIVMRLHGLIMAAAAGCRCFALSYDPKVAQVCQTFGLPGVDLGELPLDPEALCRQWVEAFRAGRYLDVGERGEADRQARQHQQVLVRVLGG